MIEGLPPDSPLVRAHERSSWGNQEWLTWDVSSQLRLLRAEVANALGASPRVEAEFLPTPRDERPLEDVVATEADEQKARQQRAEMDAIQLRIFANPN